MEEQLYHVSLLIHPIDEGVTHILYNNIEVPLFMEKDEFGEWRDNPDLRLPLEYRITHGDSHRVCFFTNNKKLFYDNKVVRDTGLVPDFDAFREYFSEN